MIKGNNGASCCDDDDDETRAKYKQTNKQTVATFQARDPTQREPNRHQLLIMSSLAEKNVIIKMNVQSDSVVMAEVVVMVVISQFGIDTNLMGSAWRPASLTSSKKGALIQRSAAFELCN